MCHVGLYRLYAFLWVIPRRLNFICQRFGTLCPNFIGAYEDGTDIVFRNVGIQNSDAGELPRRKHTTFRTLRKFEIKNEKVYISLPRIWDM
jgi:hypothetical protein